MDDGMFAPHPTPPEGMVEKVLARAAQTTVQALLALPMPRYLCPTDAPVWAWFAVQPSLYYDEDIEVFVAPWDGSALEPGIESTRINAVNSGAHALLEHWDDHHLAYGLILDGHPFPGFLSFSSLWTDGDTCSPFLYLKGMHLIPVERVDDMVPDGDTNMLSHHLAHLSGHTRLALAAQGAFIWTRPA